MRPIATDVARSMVSVFVCLSVCQNGWTDWDAVWEGWLMCIWV